MIHNDPPIARITPLENDLDTFVAHNESLCKLNYGKKASVKTKGYKEDVLQIALAFQLDRWQAANGGFWWFHVPNGGKRTKSQGDKFRKMGLKRGVADICVILPEQKVIWIELKAAWGSLEDEQKDFRDTLTRLHHLYYVVKGKNPQDVIQLTAAILRENGVVL